MSTQSTASTGKPKFAFSEDVIRQLYEMGPTKAKASLDSISLASSTDERNRDLNVSPNLNVSHGIDHEYKKDVINYEMEVEQLKTKNESLRAKLNHYESMKLSDNDFKECIKGSHENEILSLEKEKSAVMLELESVKADCVKLESFNENLLSENVTLKKEIKHLLFEKNSLEMSVDEYVKILEEKVISLDNVVQERNQLKLQVIRQKEKAEELANLQQLVKTLTNHRDTLNFQLQELAKKYSQQQDSAKIAVAKLNRTLNELCEAKETCDGLLLLINEQYSVIDQLKKKLLTLSENKEFYRKWYNVKFKQLNLQTFESESTKRLLSNSSKIFEQTLKKMKAVLSVIEYFQKTSITHQKIALLISVIHAALVNLSAEMGECARKFPRVSEFHNENANKTPSIQSRSFSDSDVSTKTSGRENGKPDLSFPSEDVFSVKCALVSFCAGNEALVKNLFSIEYFEENCERKVNETNMNTVNRSRFDELESENSDLKAELSVRNEQVFSLQKQVEQSNTIINEANNFLDELRKNLIEFKNELRNICSSCMLVRENSKNKSRSGILESQKNISESVCSKSMHKGYQSQIVWLESEFNEMKTVLVALNDKVKTLPFLGKSCSFPLKAQSSNALLKEPSNGANQKKKSTPEKELIDPQTRLLQIKESDHEQHISKVRKRKHINSQQCMLCKQCVPQEAENKLLDNFKRKTSLHLVSNGVETIQSRNIECQESVVSKMAIETFSLSQNLISGFKKIEHIPVLHKIFCKTITQLGDLLSNFEIKIEAKKGVSSNPAVILNLDTFDDSEIPYLLQRIIPKEGVLRIFFTTYSNTSYLCTFTSIYGGKSVKKLSLVAEKKADAILPESDEELSESLFLPEKEGEFLSPSENNVGVDSPVTTQKIAKNAASQKIMEPNLSQVSILSESNLHLNSVELTGSNSSQNVSRGDTYPKNVETDSSQLKLPSKSNPTLIPAETSESNSSRKIARDDTSQKITGPHSSQFLLPSKSNPELDSVEPCESSSSQKVSREETNQMHTETDLIPFPLSSKSSQEFYPVEISESNSSEKVLREDSNQRSSETESSQLSILSKKRLSFNSTEINEFIIPQEMIRGDSNQKSTGIVPNQFSAPLISNLNLSSGELSGFNCAQITLKEGTSQKDMESDKSILSSLKQDVVQCSIENSVDSRTGQTASEQIYSYFCGNNVPAEINRSSFDECAFLRLVADSEATVSKFVSGRMMSELPSSEAMSTAQKRSEVSRPKSKTYSRSLTQEVSKYSLVARVCPVKYQIREIAILDKLSEVLPYCTVRQYNEFLVRCAEKFHLNPEELFFWCVFRTALSNPLANFNQRLISLVYAIICIKLIVIKSKAVRNQLLDKFRLKKAEIEVSSGCIKNFGGFKKALSHSSKNHLKNIYFALRAMTNSSLDRYSFSVFNELSFACDHLETMQVNLSDPETRNACLQVETSNLLKYCKSSRPIGITSGSDFSKNLESANSVASRTHFQTIEEEIIGLQTAESMSQTEESVCESFQNISGGNIGIQQKSNDCNCTNGSNEVSLSKYARYVKNSKKSAKKNWFIQINHLRLKNFKIQKQLSNFKVEFLSLKNLKSLSDFEERLKKLNEFLMEKNEAQSIDEIKNSYEEKFVELRKAYEMETAESVAKIKNSYEKRIVDLRKAYGEKLTKLRERHDEDFKSLSRIYVEKLRVANEVYSQTVESTEETNMRNLEEYQRFYQTKSGEWDTVINNFSLEIINLQKYISELEEKYSMELLSAKNKYETLFNLICEAFDNEKIAIYTLLSESMNNFEDDFKESLRKIATRLDKDASISNRLFVKELERCRRQYEHNLKKQKMSYKNLLEEAKKRLEKKVSQKSLSFSKVLICNCDAAVSLEDLPTPDVHQSLERSPCEGSSCHTNVADCCAIWEYESPC